MGWEDFAYIHDGSTWRPARNKEEIVAFEQHPQQRGRAIDYVIPLDAYVMTDYLGSQIDERENFVPVFLTKVSSHCFMHKIERISHSVHDALYIHKLYHKALRGGLCPRLTNKGCIHNNDHYCR